MLYSENQTKSEDRISTLKVVVNGRMFHYNH